VYSAYYYQIECFRPYVSEVLILVPLLQCVCDIMIDNGSSKHHMTYGLSDDTKIPYFLLPQLRFHCYFLEVMTFPELSKCGFGRNTHCHVFGCR